ncbi:uncharacterized protein LOC126371089 [Pectinophora gossypiella]|uniref:Uncharacterized protein n=1 Tax=Pectinophora gossypiella TaxID=13191 RepID=A0A1E1W3D8_PECGO|nr:uncharacterized protein LOC126371089 [Pectinophora gossypiella]
MSKEPQGSLREVKIDVVKTRRHTHGPLELAVDKRNLAKVSTRSNDYVYVNAAYVGSTNSVNQARYVAAEPPTSVIREQYWACSKWPSAQRILAIAVGVLMGAVIGLVVVVVARGRDDFNLDNLFRTEPAPD